MHIPMSGIHTPKFGGYRQWLEIQLPYGLDQDGSSYIVELVLVLIMYEIFNAPNLVQSINQSILNVCIIIYQSNYHMIQPTRPTDNILVIDEK